MSPDSPADVLSPWPHIQRFLQVESSSWVEDTFHQWLWNQDTLSPAERAAANDEWADFFEWRLAQQAAELAGDRLKQYLVAKWTDSMAYCCRRSAAYARGEDPGDWIPQHLRSPDLDSPHGTTGSANSKIAPASSAL